MQYGESLNYPEIMVPPGTQYYPEPSSMYPSQQAGYYGPPMSTEVFEPPPHPSNWVPCPTEEDLWRKKVLRRIKNRDAASRYRRRKLEKIEDLRNSLHKMYAYSGELRKKIVEVEAGINHLMSFHQLGTSEP